MQVTCNSSHVTCCVRIRGRLAASARDPAQERAQILRQLAPHVDHNGWPERVREREARHVHAYREEARGLLPYRTDVL